ncbi:MAG TPA: tetratricopeptide repeat protein [Polyangiaceae bacterium]|nr:tetratricopeptide repeat protein [Polyangiaceae bacterium]
MSIEREKILQAAQKYIEKKKYDRAIVEYQRIVQEDPNDARTLLKIGDLQARLSAYPEAIATYDRVGQFYAAQGFALKAIAVYKQIRELIKKHAPDLADRYGHIVPKLADIYTQLGLTSDALAAWDEVATRLQRAGRDRDAIEVFRKMVELDAGNPLPHLRLAEACCRVQSLDEAIDSFWTAAELLLNLERSDDALKVVERILHFRQDARFARVAAELYLGRATREDGMQALAKLQICFQADPKDLETLGLLAQAFTLIGQETKAVEVYKEMARLAREQNKTDLYSQLLGHLRQIAPSDDQVAAFDSVMPAAQSVRPVESSHASLSDSDVELIDEDSQNFDVAAPAQVTLPNPRPRMASAPDVVVVDEQQEVAEELNDPSSFDARGHARKAIVDAESFRKLRLYPKAIEALHIALEIDPRSLEIREKLRELLLEAGEREAAQQESINVAQLYFEVGNVGQAELLLAQVLEVDPENHDALLLWEQLATGSSPYTEEVDDGRTRVRSAHEMLGMVSGGSQPDGFDPNEPLPSYDLEEASVEQAMHSEPGRSLSAKRSLSAMDDPFGGPGSDEPLPSFPMGSQPDDDLGIGGEQTTDVTELAQYEEDEDEQEISIVEDFIPPPAPAAAAPEQSYEGLEDVLDEAEFFAARGLYEDAKNILVEQLTRTPNHKLVLERLSEIDAQLASSGESQTKERSQLSDHGTGQGYDVAQSLGALDALEPAPESFSAESSRQMLSSTQDIDVDQVFEKFKAGVKAQVADNDSATHYDLGVAYKEMGLLPDAVGEFETAARDAARECMCFAMIGMIYLEQNQLDRAAEAYVRALSAAQKTVEQEMSLYYDLGNVYEMKGKNQDALYYFQKIARRDPGYRDVSERIQHLSPAPAPSAHANQRAANDDEFDRVFDDLFESK